MEYSTKLDHDNVPISHGNTSNDQTGKNRLLQGNKNLKIF